MSFKVSLFIQFVHTWQKREFVYLVWLSLSQITSKLHSEPLIAIIGEDEDW